MNSGRAQHRQNLAVDGINGLSLSYKKFSRRPKEAGPGLGEG